MISRVLEQCEIQNSITLIRSAEQCIKELESYHQGGAPVFSLIFLDLIMPNGGGLSVLRHLSEVDYRTNCMVVMLSGMQDMKAIQEGYQLGAKTFLLKPVSPRDLVDFLHSVPEIRFERKENAVVLHWSMAKSAPRIPQTA